MDQNQQQQQNQTVNSGLMRYRSAPSSYFTNLINTGGGVGYGVGVEDLDPFISPRPPSPETQRILARFISGGADSTHMNLSSERNEAVQSSQFVGTMKHETDVFHQNHPYPQESNMAYSSGSHVVYEGQPSDNLGSSMNIDRLPQMKIGIGGSNSNLIRHSSSPAGLFAQINVETGYSVMREMGDFSSAGPPSWDDSVLLSDNFLKGIGENDRDAAFSNFNSRRNQESEGGNRPNNNVLTHHLSLPTSSAELSSMEKLLHFQDSVPLKIRAKRGCATHPRSIAERVRRTRISERMRKLQDLVPNMDKQTNTADMLDLAVEYIKDLQNQVTKLTDVRAKCKCSK